MRVSDYITESEKRDFCDHCCEICSSHCIILRKASIRYDESGQTKEAKMYHSRLKFYREEKGMTQASLAEKSGVSLRLIQAYEQGYKDINKAQVITVLQLAEALECDVYNIINPR